MRVRRDLAIEDLPLSRSSHGPQTTFEETRAQAILAEIGETGVNQTGAILWAAWRIVSIDNSQRAWAALPYA